MRNHREKVPMSEKSMRLALKVAFDVKNNLASPERTFSGSQMGTLILAGKSKLQSRKEED
jgi:hypothetical protein